MRWISNLFNPDWWRFEWRYWRGRTPWDTRVTPPEVVAFATDAEPGRALDLGCGTGTNAVYLAQRGWTVTAIDFSPIAIRTARRRAAAARPAIDFRIGSVADLSSVSGPYDLALDIGCLFSLARDDRGRYADGLKRLLPPGARYMLYAWLPQTRNGKRWGITEEAVEALLGADFHRDRIAYGKDGPGPSAWYWFTRH
ncbi:MAG: class I SAM-dependent methyltransferase [Planctomycetia bacterium]|jgi:SAM-dependent methyltransferase